MTSSHPIQDVLGPGGVVARHLQTFEFRPSQVQMARLIQEAIHEKLSAVIEAGTGTGKTLGYLVPVVLSEKKTVISTGTKNLQEQILFKDIPLLAKATGLKIDAMLMKGRKNYLCLYRYHQHFSSPSLLGSQEQIGKKIRGWLKKTRFADRSELAWLREDDPLWESISSTSEQCLGSHCIHMEECFLNTLRKEAAQSRIIIVNHHLFFADLMVKKSGFGEIIPRFQVLIFDEAHKVEEVATSYFGESLSTHQFLDLTKDLEKESEGVRDIDGKALKNHLDLIRTGAASLLGLFSDGVDKARLNEDMIRGIKRGPARDIRRGLNYIRECGLEQLNQASLQACAHRADDLGERLERILSLHDPNWLYWCERRKRALVLHTSPLDISQSMQELLYQKKRPIIFTSATLSTNGNFDYFRSRLGLSDPVLEGIYPSHFDFRRQTLLYIPKDLPPPTDTEFGSKAAERILSILKRTSGRALVLFTSYHNLHLVHRLIDGQIPYTILKQGDAPRSLLLEEFRQDTHSVLMATGSFWQGVDVPGEALSCLVIDKLPFDSPGDPLVAARIESIHIQGGNPFMQYQLPSAIISLKQGLGRLIRNSTDRGILAILDIRMIGSRYGRFFFNSLPPIPLSHELFDIEQFFETSS